MFIIRSSSSNNVYLPERKSLLDTISIMIDLEKFTYVLNTYDIESGKVRFGDLSYDHDGGRLLKRLLLTSEVTLIRIRNDCLVNCDLSCSIPDEVDFEILKPSSKEPPSRLIVQPMTWISYPAKQYKDVVKDWRITVVEDDPDYRVWNMVNKELLIRNTDKYFKPKSDIHRLLRHVTSFDPRGDVTSYDVSILISARYIEGHDNPLLWVSGEDIVTGISPPNGKVYLSEQPKGCYIVVPDIDFLLSSLTNEVSVTKLDVKDIGELINTTLLKDPLTLSEEQKEVDLDIALTEAVETELVVVGDILAKRADFILNDCLQDDDILDHIHERFHEAIETYIDNF